MRAGTFQAIFHIWKMDCNQGWEFTQENTIC